MGKGGNGKERGEGRTRSKGREERARLAGEKPKDANWN